MLLEPVVELLPPQPVRARLLKERVKARSTARAALRSLERRRRERRRESRRTAPAREAGRGSCFQGEGGGVVLRALGEPGRAEPVEQEEELVLMV